MSIVNFICAGAGKSGTTWLHACMEEHPEIFVPPIKEIDFFSWHFEKGIAWYESHFRGVTKEKAVGEISPSYMYTENVPQRIYQYNPRMRLIFVLRDPIERAYSHYCMALYSGSVSADIDRELSVESYFVRQGLYFTYLRRFLQFFPSTQMLVMLYDDLVSNPANFLYEVFSFLEVNPRFAPSLLNKRYHYRKPPPRFPRLTRWFYRTVQRLQRRSRMVDITINYLRKHGFTSILHTINRKGSYPNLTQRKIRELVAFYREDIFKLSEVINRDLSIWIDKYTRLG